MLKRFALVAALATAAMAITATPAAAATVDLTAPDTGDVGETVTATVVLGQIDIIAIWSLDWGDGTQGTFFSSAGTYTETHEYQQPGTYMITATADGTSDTHMITIAGFDGRFADDDGSTFEADIEWLAAEGITAGCNPPANTLFCPSNSVTRGQMAAFLVRALDYTDPGTAEFTDTVGNTFELDIKKLATAGVTLGCNPPTNDQYCPDRAVTRGQMAAFLVRALGYTDLGTTEFTDTVGNTFELDIKKLAAAGVTAGCNPPANDRYCPDRAVTRGQMAAFLHRALGN